jgi:hypothetical protein
VATTREPDPSAFISLTTVRRLIYLQTLGEWDTRWKTSKSGGALCYIDKSPPSLQPIPLYCLSSLSRNATSSLSQLRIGPSFLNAHRFKSGFTPSPACEACGAAFETRAHYLLDCPAWEHLRRPLHEASRTAGCFGPLHLTPLLADPKLLKPLAKFIESTGRFTRA